MSTSTTEQLPLAFDDPPSTPLGQPVVRDRKAYNAEVSLRWSHPALRDARGNWFLFEEHHDDLVEILRPYLRDCWCEDLAGKCHNPAGTLTAWLWKCSDANGWVWDFCEHYQKCHLRRGLIAYAKQVIGEMQANNPIQRREASSGMPGSQTL